MSRRCTAMSLLSDFIMSQTSRTFVSTVEQKFLLGRTKNSITPSARTVLRSPRSQMQKSVNYLWIVFYCVPCNSYCSHCKSGVLQVISCNLEPCSLNKLIIITAHPPAWGNQSQDGKQEVYLEWPNAVDGFGNNSPIWMFGNYYSNNIQ